MFGLQNCKLNKYQFKKQQSKNSAGALREMSCYSQVFQRVVLNIVHLVPQPKIFELKFLSYKAHSCILKIYGEKKNLNLLYKKRKRHSETQKLLPRSSRLVQWVWVRSQLRLGFNPWPGNFHVPGVWP